LGGSIGVERNCQRWVLPEGWKTSLARASLITNAKMNPCDRLAESITPTHRHSSLSIFCMANAAEKERKLMHVSALEQSASDEHPLESIQNSCPSPCTQIPSQDGFVPPAEQAHVPSNRPKTHVLFKAPTRDRERAEYALSACPS
jgi:hypothetical protein